MRLRPMTFSLAILLLAPWASLLAAEDKAALPEAVAYKLEQAKSAYQRKVEQFRADLLKDLEVKENQARGKGDKKLVDQLKAERTALETRGQLPRAVSTTAYETRVRQARADAEAAFNAAIKDLLRTRKDDQAAEVERRLVAFQKDADSAAGTIDLLALIDVAKDAAVGRWERDGAAITVEATRKQWSVLQIPYAPPEEYEIEMVTERLKTPGDIHSDIQIGAVLGGRRFFIVLDGWNATTSGISFIDGKGASENGATFRGKLFADGKPAKVVASFTKEGVTVTVDGKPVIKYSGPPQRLSGADAVTSNKSALFLAVEKGAAYRIDVLRLKPITGEGKSLR